MAPTVKPATVLAVTSEPPWPLNAGGHIRTFHLLKSLAASTRLRLVCPVDRSQQDSIRPIQAAGIDLVPVAVDERTPRGEVARMMGAMFRRQPYVMYRRHRRPAVAAVWRAELLATKPDVVYFDHLDSFVYHSPGRRAPACASVIDLHNVYSLLARRSADDQSSALRRAFLRHQARLLEKMERRVATSCSSLFAVSDTEASYFRALGARAVRTIPNGVDCEAFSTLPIGRTGSPTIMFLGSMSWGPNVAAARFLAVDVFPGLKHHLPDARLVIVGRDPPDDIRALARTPGIEVTGTVPSVLPYLRDASLLAVPLDAGGGTRLKILEAFAAGLPVVSTAVGAEGIAAEPGRHFVQAERPAFGSALTWLLTNPGAGVEMAGSARALAHARYDWRNIGAEAARVVGDLAADTASVRRGR